MVRGFFEGLVGTGRVRVEVITRASALGEFDPGRDRFGFARVPLRGDSYSTGFRLLPLWRAVRESRPDVVLAMTEGFDTYLLQLGLGRMLGMFSGRLLFYGFENLPLNAGRRHRFLVKPLWRYVSGGAAASSQAIQVLRDAGFPKEKPLALVPSGVPVPRDVFESASRESVRHGFGIGDGFAIGYVGRLIAAKGLIDLVRALARLPDTTAVYFLGGGELAEEIRKEAADLGVADRVHLLGEMAHERVQEFMASIDVLVLPSRTMHHWKEQFGRVIPEAMLASTPVVGSDSGAIPEVIGDAGLVFPEGDVGKLADALRELITDEARRTELSARGLKRATELYTLDAMADGLVGLMERL